MPIVAEPIEKTNVYVTYQSAPSWQVGEDGETRVLEAPDRAQLIGDDHYPGDYSGRIQSVQKQGITQDRGFWRCKRFALSAAMLQLVRKRRVKVERGALVPVTDEDEWGALWPSLEGTTTLADLELDPTEQPNEEAAEAARFKIEMASLRMRLLKKALPVNIAHTGTGYYAVKAAPTHNNDTQSGAPAGQVVTLTTGGLGTADAFKGGYVTNATRAETRAIVSHDNTTVTLEGSLANWLDTDDLDIYDAWTTVQGALDQLWTDQGSTEFAASQYIRIFAGTHTENDITPNASLNPAAGKCYQLVIEGDPDDDRDDMILAAAGGTNGLYINCDGFVLRHLKVTGSASATLLKTWSGVNDVVELDDLHFSGGPAEQVKLAYAWHTWVHDCAFGDAVSGAGCLSLVSTRMNRIERCTFDTPNGSGACGITYNYDAALFVDTCRFTNVDHVAYWPGSNYLHNGTICVWRNCTFEGRGTGVALMLSSINSEVTDCIFQGFVSAYAMRDWPGDTATVIGPDVRLRNNYYYDCTDATFARRRSDDTYKTQAEFVALANVDSSGEVVADPKITDGMLDADSPCINAGIGSGVVYDVNGVAAPNVYHPAIGCDFSRDYAASATPCIVERTVKESGGDYTSLAAWEVGEERNLVSLNEVAVAKISGAWASAEAGNVEIGVIDRSDSWVTSDLCRIKIYCEDDGARHVGKWTSDAYRIEGVGASGLLRPYVNFITIEGLQVGVTNGGSYSTCIGDRNAAIDRPTDNEIVIDGCICREISNSGTSMTYGIWTNGGGNYKIRNCYMYDFYRAGIIVYSQTRSLALENCTVYGVVGNGRGIFLNDSSMVSCDITNCAVFNCDDDIYNDAYGTFTYCATEDGVAGTGNVSITQSADNYAALVVDAGDGDFHVTTVSSELYQAGTDLSSDFIKDISGKIRVAPWDIGAAGKAVTEGGMSAMFNRGLA